MKQILVLNITPELEESLVDYLLEHGEEGFTSYPVRGHGEHTHLSIAEQVSGRRKRVQFELILDESRIDPILAGLRTAVGAGIVWWLQAVLRSGRI